MRYLRATFDRSDPASPTWGVLRRLSVPTALFVCLALLVQARLLARADETLLGFVTQHRPLALAEPMNWIFRLGFVQVDVLLALIWAGWLLVRCRSLTLALAPLVLLLAIGVQVGLRLVVDQPPPGPAYAFNRAFGAQPIANALDRLDSTVRQTFAPPVPAAPERDSGERGSFPSGHACRSVFLGLLAATTLTLAPGSLASSRKTSLARRLVLVGLALLVLLIGYSTMYWGYHWPSDLLGGYLLGLVFYRLAVALREHASLELASARAWRWLARRPARR
jgi:membrane-associated phospholipid phosphatase